MAALKGAVLAGFAEAARTTGKQRSSTSQRRGPSVKIGSFPQVALQEPVLRAAHFSFEWSVAPRFPDVRGAITEVLRSASGDSNDWFWDSDSESGSVIVVSNEDERLHLFARPRGVDVISEKPDLEALSGTAAACLDQCLRLLNVHEVSAARAGATWLLAAADSRQAEATLEKWLFDAHLRTTLDPFGGRPDDLVVMLRFDTESGVTTFLRAEPVTDEEAAASPYFLSDLDSADFPPAGLIVDMSRQHGDTFDATQALERAGRHLGQLRAQGERLLATVEME